MRQAKFNAQIRQCEAEKKLLSSETHRVRQSTNSLAFQSRMTHCWAENEQHIDQGFWRGS